MTILTSNNNDDYCSNKLGSAVTEKLQAAAFRELCRHLQERSDVVGNMDMMTLTGFCRNCLAKWMVLGARQLVDNNNNNPTGALPLAALNAFGYDEAAAHVYGMGYPEWKQRYQQTAATPEQLERWEASKPWQAQHDKALLEKRTTVVVSSSLASNVCCQESPAPRPSVAKDARILPSYVAPPLPPSTHPIRWAVVTVSDRAAQNAYATGDLSGPAVVQAITSMTKSGTTPLLIDTAIVPDDRVVLQEQLRQFGTADIVVTTGGTGFGPRDGTPEAVRGLEEFVELAHVMPFVTAACAQWYQPLSSLSRGVAGVLHGGSVIATLPGNPQAVREMMPLLLPLLLHAVEELRSKTAPSC